MRKAKGLNAKRLTAFILTAIMASQSLAFVSGATQSEANAVSEYATVNNSRTENSLDEMAMLMTSTAYAEYLQKYADVPKGTADITIEAVNYNPEKSECELGQNSVLSNYDGMEGDSLVMPEEGRLTYDVEIPETGLYNIEFTYYPYAGKSASIERIISIDGKVPYKEARYIQFSRVWVDDYIEPGKRVFKTDINGNEVRPGKFEKPRWDKIVAHDSSTFYNEPLLFYLEEGTREISITSSREPLLLKSFRIYSAPETKSYAQAVEEYKQKGYKDAEVTEVKKIDAETPVATSSQVVYPLNDRTSAITEPQDSTKVLLNEIGGEKWQIGGQWVEWSFEAPESGLYQIVARYKQSINAGLFSSRSLTIDGVCPFAEAKSIQFKFSDDWQVGPLCDDDGTPFLFYIEKGTHTLRLEVVLGDMADYLRQIDESVTRMNEYYRKIIMITGSNADQYTDYDFAKLIPEVLRGMRNESELLVSLSSGLEKIIGEKGANSVILDKIAYLLDIMGRDQDQIAGNLSNFKSHIGSLSTWLLTARNQPLEIDYLIVQPATLELPKANASFFQALKHEIGAFIMSFFSDYDSLGATEEYDESDESIIEVWVTTGREQTQIMRQMVDDSFSPETGEKANLKLIAAGTLLPATLAGVGPDVSMDADPVGFGIRGAVKPINDFEGYDEVATWFHPETLVPLTIFDPDQPNPHTGEMGYEVVYGLPSTLSFPMLFYRKDVFVDLGLEVPETWDDIYDIIRALSENNLEIGLSQALTQIFMYQQNIPWFQGDTVDTVGIRTNLCTNESLAAFQKMTDFFTMYGQPVAYDFANRFRTGEMPIAIQDYMLYNQLTVFAPEISGLWEFVQLPGIEDENGVINHASPAGVSAIMMMSDATQPEKAWKFMKWWVSEETQSRFGNEQVAIMGTAAKYNTANMKALESQPWTAQELRNLRQQSQSLMGTPMSPGNYIVSRYTNFAFYDVYDDGMTASEAMLQYEDDINNELTRKRAEYNFKTAEEFEAEQAAKAGKQNN